MKKTTGRIAVILTGLLLFLVSFLGFGAVWGLTTWGKIDIDEIIFQLQAPLGGTESGILFSYFLKGLFPVIAITLAYIIIQIRIKSQKKKKIFTAVCFAVSIAACLGIKQYIWQRLDMDTWIAGQMGESDFIENKYVDPGKVKLEFPEQKRNLIYIFLESMETTFADEGSGGAFPENVIPELTALARENEDFSGADPALNGGVSHIGTTFTTGGIFAQTTGLPLRIGIGINNMDTQDSFFPSIVSLGDILKKEGYRQVFLCGSEAKFGGRALYFHDHGGYECRDYVYAKEQGLIPSDYKVWWGFEDEKLFSFAKDTLLELAAGEEPFNFTLLTVDTHFEGGYVCRLCGDEFGDNQYANVMACSSRQVADFVSWIREQDFFENTTLILGGDHITMSKTFCSDVDESYRRKAYTAYINSAVQPADGDARRKFSTFDAFPTTLAAMGVRIDGERLGLGTNLFSGRATLSEEYGDDQLEKELIVRSPFLEQLEKTDALSDTLVERYRSEMEHMLSAESYDAKTGEVRIRLKKHFSTEPRIDSFEAVYQETGSAGADSIRLEPAEGSSDEYAGTLDLSGWEALDGDVRITLHLSDGGQVEELTSIHLCDLSLLHGEPAEYLRCLQKYRDKTILIAVKDDAAKEMSEDVEEELKALGLRRAQEISGRAGSSYLALLEKETVEEKAGFEPLSLEGVLRDGRTAFLIESAGHDCGSHAGITINGKDYALNKRGLNIVVYDSAREQVIDSVRLKTEQ